MSDNKGVLKFELNNLKRFYQQNINHIDTILFMLENSDDNIQYDIKCFISDTDIIVELSTQDVISELFKINDENYQCLLLLANMIFSKKKGDMLQ